MSVTHHGAMTTLRLFECNDLFKFNRVNLDPLTETVRPPPRHHPASKLARLLRALATASVCSGMACCGLLAAGMPVRWLSV